MPDLDKILPVAGQTAGNAIAAVRQIQNRLGRIHEVRDRQGEFGLLFRMAYELPQHLYRWGLVACALAGLGVFTGGVLRLVDSTALPWLQQVFTDQWLTVFAIGLLLLGITLLEAITWVAILALGPIPPIRRSIDWYNIRQFCTLLERPKPLALNGIAIDSLADFAIRKLTANKDLGAQFASKPFGLTASERANLALFGCLIEQEHYVRKWQLRNWGAFYEALAHSRLDGVSIFAETTIRNVRAQNQDYYSAIRVAADPNLVNAQQSPLEDSVCSRRRCDETRRRINWNLWGFCGQPGEGRREPDRCWISIRTGRRVPAVRRRKHSAPIPETCPPLGRVARRRFWKLHLSLFVLSSGPAARSRCSRNSA